MQNLNVVAAVVYLGGFAIQQFLQILDPLINYVVAKNWSPGPVQTPGDL